MPRNDPPESSIEEAFQSSKTEAKDWIVKVDVLHKKSSNVYIIADNTGFCDLKIESPDISESIEEKVVKILNPQVSKEDNTLILGKCSSLEISPYNRLNISLKYCKGCDQIKNVNALLKHISHSKKCKAIYGETKFAKMKTEMRSHVNLECYQKNNDQYNKTRSDKNQKASKVKKPREVIKKTDQSKSKEDIEDEERRKRFEDMGLCPSQYTRDRKCPFCKNIRWDWGINPGYTFHWELKEHIKSCHTFTCKGCFKPLNETAFFKHVSHSPECKEEYGEDEWNEMSKNQRNKVTKRYEMKRRSQATKYKKESYQKNKHKIIERVNKVRKAAKVQKQIDYLKKWLVGRNECEKKKISEERKKFIEALLGGIYYYEKVNSSIGVPNIQISETISKLKLDIEVGKLLEEELIKEFSDVMTKVNNLILSDGGTIFPRGFYHKMVEPYRKMIDNFSEYMRDQWRMFENTVEERFIDLANILEKEHQPFVSEYCRYHKLAIGWTDGFIAVDFEKPVFLQYCETAFFKAL